MMTPNLSLLQTALPILDPVRLRSNPKIPDVANRQEKPRPAQVEANRSRRKNRKKRKRNRRAMRMD